MRIPKTGVYHINVGGRPSKTVPFQISSLLGDISRKVRQVAKLLNVSQPIREVNFNLDPRLLSSDLRISAFRSLLNGYLLSVEIGIEGMRENRSVPEQELENLIRVNFTSNITYRLNIDPAAGKIDYSFRYLGRTE
jgi:hypothetical protein